MPVFVSTCRKPRQQTRSIAKLLALLLDSKYENRGKRSVEEVVSRAAHAGFTRVAFLHEKHGALSSIEFYDREKGWLPEVIAVRKAETFEVKSRIPKELVFEAEGAGGRKMAEVLQLEQSEVGGLDNCVAASLSSAKLVFRALGRKRLELAVSLLRLPVQRS